ncbi:MULTISPECIES: phosphatase [Streptomyces]|uniref:phosphatase n=1 Tax=Streptomyces TaxID=1883 RepID=UPI0022499BD5|nr:phosphatase [Streptomyces sp. JHD 1]MCX2968936.1 phosphatase [Streptomyces sp. JHD 1]
MLSSDALRAHLASAAPPGAVAEPGRPDGGRLDRYRLFAARDPRALLGLEPRGRWSVVELVGLVAERCGTSPDAVAASGCRIDPARTVDALDAFADRLGAAARRRAAVLLGTGRPRSLLDFFGALAAALEAAGCRVLTPRQGRGVAVPAPGGPRAHTLTAVRGVALVRGNGLPCAPDAPGAPCRSPLPLRVALADLAAAGAGVPELVIGDHGWLCGAGQLGIDAVGPAGTADPAPFVAEAEGTVRVAVPLDDAVARVHYLPLTRYVLNRARLSQ